MSNNRRYQTRTVAWTLVLAMLFSFVLPTFAANAQDTETLPIQLITEQQIGEGVLLQTYNKKISGKKSWVYVTKVDLNNPYAQVRPLYGKNGAFTAKQSVEALAKEKGAIAAINADFFTMKNKTPFGITVDQQEVVSSMARVPAWYSLGILQDQTAIIEHFNYKGKVTTPTGESFPIQGVNKEQYMATGIQSHKDQINLYTPKFGSISIGSLPGLGDYTEVVVENNIVKDMRVNQPNGATIPANGYVLWGNGSGSSFLSSKFKVGDYVDISSSHTSTSGREDILSAMGGHLLLVDNGKALQPYDRTITGKVSRSAVGVSQDGKTLYLVAVEGPPNGRGMELPELAQTMKELGVYRAANLDGGGSTTMVARKLAETNLSLINVTAYGSQRQIPTAIGVFNTAPTGSFKDFRIEGPAQVLKGTEASFQVKAWDEHFHPYAVNPSDVTWTGVDPFSGNKILALTTGVQDITASYQGVQQTRKIEVIGASAVSKLIVEPSVIAVNKGQSVTFKVKVQTKDGKVMEITPKAATASVPTELGTIDGFTFTGGEADGNGQMTVNFDGIEVKIPVSVGTMSQRFENFDTVQNQLTYTTLPKDISALGSFTQTKEGEPARSGKAVKLQYNFGNAPSDELRAAYGGLRENPLPLPGTPIGVGMWIYGDDSKHWLRSEIVDANGKIHYMTLAKEIDFTGWKYIEGQVPSEVVYPIKMKSIYVVSLPEGADTRPNQGTLFFDELELYQPFDPVNLVINPFKDVKSGSWYENAVVQLYNEGIVSGMSADSFAPNTALTRAQFVTILGNWLGWKADPAHTLDFTDKIPEYAVPAVKVAVSKGIVQGFPGKLFKANEPLTRAQMAVMLYLSLQDRGDQLMPGPTLPFIDEKAIPQWAKEAVQVMSSKGYIKGMEGSFQPNGQATRAQAAALIYQIKQ